MTSKGFQSIFFDGYIVDKNGSRIDFIKSGEQIDNGRFSRTRGSYQCHGLSWRYFERNAFDNLFVCIVAEMHLLKFNFPLGILHMFGTIVGDM